MKTLIFIAMFVSSCTLSMQNVDNHAPATDLVDDNLSTTPSVTLTPKL